MTQENGTQAVSRETSQQQVAVAGPPRLPWHPLIEERFGVDRASWKALVEAVYPNAKSTESVTLALSYCRARNLDPFKRPVHIVPIYDREKRRYVETIWPGIGELRTTAQRTKAYAGRDGTAFGDMMTQVVGEGEKAAEVTFPEWAQVTVYRMIQGQRVAFAGPCVYWLETYAETKGGAPNSMWRKRPRGQLDKCAEAAALRMAFPEELGEDFIDAEAAMVYQHGAGQAQMPALDAPPRPTRAQFQEVQDDAPTNEAAVAKEAEPEAPQPEEAPEQEAAGSGGSAGDRASADEAADQDDTDYKHWLMAQIDEQISRQQTQQLMNSQARMIAGLKKSDRDAVQKAAAKKIKDLEAGR